MYNGRDMSELTMEPRQNWADLELSYFHYALSQTAPYLNQEGIAILREINNEIKRRGEIQEREEPRH